MDFFILGSASVFCDTKWCKKMCFFAKKEQELMKDLLNGIVACGGDITVLTLVQKYILQKAGVRHTTKAGYKTAVNILKNE